MCPTYLLSVFAAGCTPGIVLPLSLSSEASAGTVPAQALLVLLLVASDTRHNSRYVGCVRLHNNRENVYAPTSSPCNKCRQMRACMRERGAKCACARMADAW